MAYPAETDPIIRELSYQLLESEQECSTLKRKLEHALSKNESLKKKYQVTKEGVQGNYVHFISRYSFLNDNSNTCLLSVLHDDLLAHVFMFLEPVTSCLILSRVCKGWRRLLSSSLVLWHSWYTNYNFLFSTCTDPIEKNRAKLQKPPPINDYQLSFLRIRRAEERWRSGEPLSSATVKGAHVRAINCMYHDGQYLYTAGSSGHYVKKWDPESLECLDCFTVPAYKPLFCELELCGAGIAVVNDVVRGKMSIWRLGNPAPDYEVSEYIDMFDAADGSIVTHSSKGLVQTRDLLTGEAVNTYSHMESVRCLALQDDLFVSAVDDVMMIWDIRSGLCSQTYACRRANRVLFDGQRIIAMRRSFRCDTSIIDLRMINNAALPKVVGHSDNYECMYLERNKLVFGLCKEIVTTWDLRKDDDLGEANTPTSSVHLQDKVASIVTYKERMFCGLKNGDLQAFVF